MVAVSTLNLGEGGVVVVWIDLSVGGGGGVVCKHFDGRNDSVLENQFIFQYRHYPSPVLCGKYLV